MIILDTETTGLLKPEAAGAAAQPQIIDFAAVKINDYTGEEVDRIQMLIHPGKSIPPEITKITGYIDKDFNGKAGMGGHINAISNFFLGERAMLAHNLPFDKGLLYWELVRMDMVTSFPWPPQQLCTVQLYMQEFGKRMKLVDLYAAKLGRPLHQLHTAMADVEALLEIVRQEQLWLAVDTGLAAIPEAALRKTMRKKVKK